MKELLQKLPFWIMPGAVLCLLALGLDAVGSTETTAKVIGISSVNLALLFFLPLVISKFFSQWFLPPTILSVLRWAIILTLGLAATLIIGEYLTPDNYVYSLTRLNSPQLLIVTHFWLGLYLIAQPLVWWKKNLPTLIQAWPAWLLAVSWLVRLLPFDVFASYSQEDGLMENLQNLVLILTSGFCFRAAWRSWLAANKKRALFLAALGLGFLIILLEEISWGQRLFGWTTPEALKEVNVQNETTLHNIGILNQLQLVAYLLISLAGWLLSWRKKLFSWKETDCFWRPQPGSSLLFLIIFIFYLHFTFVNHNLHNWTEIIELLLYSGLFFWVLKGIQSGLKTNKLPAKM